MNNKDTLAIFDFDGTLTTKDTFIEFAKFAVGRKSLLAGVLHNLVWLVAWKLKLVSGGIAKQRLFSYLFGGMPISLFEKHCIRFAKRIRDFERDKIVEKLQYHLSKKDMVFIITASIPDWIIPWAMAYGVKKENVVGTVIEVDDNGFLSGQFSTPNCYGEEKVKRLKDLLPELTEYEIFAYGDSRGDLPLLDIADHGELIH